MKTSLVVALVISTGAIAFLGGRLSLPSSTSQATAYPIDVGAMKPLPMAPASANAIHGRVAEIIQVPSYTYLRLETSNGDTWAAVSTDNALKKGDEVSITNAMAMHGFNSTTLKRSFDTIYFAQVAAR